MRLELIALIAVVALGGYLEYKRMSDSLRDAKAEIVTVQGKLDQAVKDKHATELGLARAESPKERVREVIRTVTLPPVSVDCRNDPAVLAAYNLIGRMRDAARRGDDPAADTGAPAGTVRRPGADGRPGG